MTGIRNRLAPLLLVLLASTLVLAGCGFQLRGTADLPEAMRIMQLVSVDPGSDMEREVARALRNNDVFISDDADSPFRLGLGREFSTERTLSVNANARAGEYELEMSVLFQLSRSGETLLAPRTVRITRSYLTDPENAIAKQEEAELIREEMRREIAQQILRQLQTVTL